MRVVWKEKLNTISLVAYRLNAISLVAFCFLLVRRFSFSRYHILQTEESVSDRRAMASVSITYGSDPVILNREFVKVDELVEIFNLLKKRNTLKNKRLKCHVQEYMVNN